MVYFGINRAMRLASGICLGLALAGQVRAAETPSQAFRQLLDDSWEFSLREDPLLASHVGDHRYDALLPKESLADQQRRQEANQEFLRRFQEIPRQQLSPAEQVHYDVFGWLLKGQIAEYEFKTHLMPITGRSGFHISFPELPRESRLESVQDYRNYLQRLNAFGDYLDQHLELMREGIRRGMLLPEIVLRGSERTVTGQIVATSEQSPLFAPFLNFPSHFSRQERSQLTIAGRQAILNTVIPAYERLQRFLKEEYLPSLRGDVAASSLPRGREFYRHRVEQFTTLPLSPDEVHQIGLREVARIQAEMEQAIKQAKWSGDLAGFIEHLRTDERFYPQTPEQLMEKTALVLKRMDGELPRFFGRLPRTPYGIRPVPEFIAHATTSAYYSPAPGDGSRAGFYYVNTYNLPSRPLYDVEALSLHEAVPGHHLQIALQHELQDLPPFRRHAPITAFIEGWALYAERIGLECGFYQDPYSNFGRLNFEMWRACRLVVDTGLHWLGWTRQQAIDYLAARTALSLHNITVEVDRYISWPGQALAYKMGELKIRELRALAEKELGEKFDIRKFHDRVLANGAVPLPVLEQDVQAFIQQEKNEK